MIWLFLFPFAVFTRLLNQQRRTVSLTWVGGCSVCYEPVAATTAYSSALPSLLDVYTLFGQTRKKMVSDLCKLPLKQYF